MYQVKIILNVIIKKLLWINNACRLLTEQYNRLLLLCISNIIKIIIKHRDYIIIIMTKMKWYKFDIYLLVEDKIGEIEELHDIANYNINLYGTNIQDITLDNAILPIVEEK